MSVPIEMEAAAFSVASRSSGRMAAKSVVTAFVRKPMRFRFSELIKRHSWKIRSPIALMTLAYAMLSTMILAISGKCQPYHSYPYDVKCQHPLRPLERMIDLHTHSVDVNLLVEVIEESDSLDDHGVDLVRRELELESFLAFRTMHSSESVHVTHRDNE